MIEVILAPTGDSAEADDPEAAVFAARTLMNEAEAHGAASRFLRATFLVEGQVVRSNVRRADLTGGAA